MTAVERERADAMDVRCLDLCIGMLECVNGVGPSPHFPLSINRSLRLHRHFDTGRYPRRADRAGGKVQRTCIA
jgi:hypothetical protein